MPESKHRRKKKGRSKTTTTVSQPTKRPTTAKWVIPTTFGLWIIGVLAIILNYMGLFGGQAQNPILFAGLGLIAVGFLLSTRIY